MTAIIELKKWLEKEIELYKDVHEKYEVCANHVDSLEKVLYKLKELCKKDLEELTKEDSCYVDFVVKGYKKDLEEVVKDG